MLTDLHNRQIDYDPWKQRIAAEHDPNAWSQLPARESWNAPLTWETLIDQLERMPWTPAAKDAYIRRTLEVQLQVWAVPEPASEPESPLPGPIPSHWDSMAQYIQHGAVHHE
jgi:hypothetical protein